MTQPAFRPKPLDWILARSRSVFCDVIRARCAAGDTPTAARVFTLDRDHFAHIEFTGGRWLVLAIDPALAPVPALGGCP